MTDFNFDDDISEAECEDIGGQLADLDFDEREDRDYEDEDDF